MRTRLTAILLAAAAVTTPAAAAFAQPTAGSATAAAAPAPAAVGADPNIDRGFLLPTAMTQPAGSLTYNNYELLLHGLTYGITDDVQLSATALSPITRDMPFFATAAVKGRLPVGERLHLALQGSASYGHIFDDGNLGMLGAGALASFCLRTDCSSLFTAAATYQLAIRPADGDDSGGTAHLLVYGASVVHRVGRHVKLLGEVASATVRDASQDFDNAPGVLLSYGLRFHGDSLAADVGFMKPLSTEDELNDAFLLGLPFVSLSYRW
jgi:hypothetical protein